MEKVKKPSIFEYTNYRLFLADLYFYLKETTEYFSYRYFAKKAGFKSPNYLKLVIEGDRNISMESVEKFSSALKLNKKEGQFFSLLVEFAQADNNSDRAEVALKILRSKIYQKMNPIREDQLNYLNRWYQIGIRELAICSPLPEDYEWIANQFCAPLKTSEAKQAVESLVRLGMLEKDKTGHFVACEKNIVTDNEVVSSIAALYHKNMLDKAKESIDIVPAKQRDISSVCVPVSECTFKKMKEKIQDFRKELIALADEDQYPNQVYQLNFQIFPITNAVEDDT